MKTVDATNSVPFPMQLEASVGTRLLVFAGGFPVPHKIEGEVVVGRGDDASIKLEDRSLSRKHAKITVGDDVVTVEDLGSTNGTRVGGAKITGKVVVQPGELIHFGNLACVIERVTQRREAPRLSKAQQLEALIQLVAQSDIGVLIHGETGSGKEVTARAIHSQSARRDKPFVAFNAAAIPENLVESELFGFEKGAFSGADRAKPGILESADGGTLLLDEIAEMPLTVQAKLLRVLEEREVQRLGALKPRKIDIRLVSASHKLLDDEVDAGRFRQDLYFRVNGIAIELPPLRERLDELDAFAEQFLHDAAARAKKPAPAISKEAARVMRSHDWPGNLRELKNCMERALVLSAGAGVIGPEHVPLPTKTRSMRAVGKPPPAAASSTGERERIIAALSEAGGNQYRAAEILGISRRTLVNRLEQYDIPRPRKG